MKPQVVGIHHVDWGGLELSDAPASASRKLELKVCTTLLSNDYEKS